MPYWQEALLLLGLFWALQCVGTWAQMRHYRRVMGEIARSWPDGCVGASAARGTFGKGVIAILVTGPDEIVRQLFFMEGRSVFAKFHEVPAAAGRSLAELASGPLDAAHKGRRKALAGAIEQVRGVLSRAAAQAGNPHPA